MPQSIDTVYLHVIFSTKDRFPFFSTSELQREVHAYLAGVAKKLGCPAVKVGGVADHVHLLIKLGRTITIADFVKETKRVSSLWLKEREGENKGGGDGWDQFHWQTGYGAFSVSQSNVDQVERYIVNQAEHHRTQTFQEEYRAFLAKHKVEADERYLWD